MFMMKSSFKDHSSPGRAVKVLVAQLILIRIKNKSKMIYNVNISAKRSAFDKRDE